MNDLAGIVDFIRARLDDEEALATAADVKQGDPDWWVSPVLATGGEHFTVRTKRDNRPIARVQRLDGDEPFEPAGILDGASVSDHIALHDPARTLREVAVHRAIIEMHRDVGNRVSYCNVCGGRYPCLTVRHLAGIWSDHPSWRSEWSVTE